ncbi:MerR family transcriptional regulator [Bacillus paralicheniformis]|jgi:DNA-binding transcriptional MerR regulator/effector-binding domain-containing protein|uniref:Multidrug-efflux transporter 1 regulator n=1 Tax=Bacillus paralicheniformis TaxID=1648923 RepID=A0A6I7TIK3_9BACI|nr:MULTISPECIES: MerR family transcriptional regulator [Bacillus]KUL11063.1 DNA-binding protein [Bacillus licheniformis LMG 7559]KUL16827.1 DNA-binding protein [Bacillus licheniformis LMG 6934]AJO19227.1 YdfL protein [Bacillus paralicheniformis]MCB6216298.1 MerR family transcriptional regulator [Bacillus paralicheniformis]MCM3421755.1 MerR family transcriptional regulator [Bacillus paralicheniformis]
MVNNRFRVGEVARLFKLPASTLRYYDEIGLFKPKYTDPETSYRYYGVEQFQVLDTIIFLRKNGFSLKDIQHQLDKRTPETTMDILKKKLEEVRMEICRLQRSAARIENKISTIEEGIKLAGHPALTFQYFPKRPVSYLYFDKPVDLIEEGDDIYLKDRETLSSQSIENNGFFTGDIGTIVDMESLKQEGPVKYIGLFELLHGENSNEYLNEGLYASYPHIGPYEDMRKSYQLVLRQLKEKGYKLEGIPVEISVLDEAVIKESDHFVTLIQIPVTKF